MPSSPVDPPGWRPRRSEAVDLHRVESPREGVRIVLHHAGTGRSLVLPGGERDAYVWAHLDGASSVGDIALATFEEFGEIHPDLASLLERLRDEGFLAEPPRDLPRSSDAGERLLRLAADAVFVRIPIPGAAASWALLGRLSAPFFSTPVALLAALIALTGLVLALGPSRALASPTPLLAWPTERGLSVLGGVAVLLLLNLAVDAFEGVAQVATLARGGRAPGRVSLSFDWGIPGLALETDEALLLPLEGRLRNALAPLFSAGLVAGLATVAHWRLAPDHEGAVAVVLAHKLAWVAFLRCLVHACPLGPTPLYEALRTALGIPQLRRAVVHALLGRRAIAPAGASAAESARRELAVLAVVAASVVWLTVVAWLGNHLMRAEFLPLWEGARAARNALRLFGLTFLGTVAAVPALLALGGSLLLLFRSALGALRRSPVLGTPARLALLLGLGVVTLASLPGLVPAPAAANASSLLTWVAVGLAVLGLAQGLATDRAAGAGWGAIDGTLLACASAGLAATLLAGPAFDAPGVAFLCGALALLAILPLAFRGVLRVLRAVGSSGALTLSFALFLGVVGWGLEGPRLPESGSLLLQETFALWTALALLAWAVVETVRCAGLWGRFGLVLSCVYLLQAAEVASTRPWESFVADPLLYLAVVCAFAAGGGGLLAAFRAARSARQPGLAILAGGALLIGLGLLSWLGSGEPEGLLFVGGAPLPGRLHLPLAAAGFFASGVWLLGRARDAARSASVEAAAASPADPPPADAEAAACAALHRALAAAARRSYGASVQRRAVASLSEGEREVLRSLAQGSPPGAADTALPTPAAALAAEGRALALRCGSDLVASAVREALARLPAALQESIAQGPAALLPGVGEVLRAPPAVRRELFARAVPFLDLGPADLDALADLVGTRTFAAGEEILHQGEPGDFFYLLVSGEVRVLFADPWEGTREVAWLAAGDAFGEGCLFGPEPRTATVVASRPCLALTLHRETFAAFVRARPAVGECVRARRDDLRLLRSARVFAGLRTEELALLCRRLRPVRCAPGEALIVQGEPGDRFYVVRSGAFEVRRRAADGSESPIARLGPGDVCGEIALLSDRPRVASVVALEASEALALEREDFHELLGGRPGQRIARQSLERLRALPEA
ncbi:MAG: hypothetical protein D6731_23975 [Planctomycetota bacterium]|nr:MAG: hypothetical protein D6731_23975 [Planctomycetota bacterium]